MRLHCSCDCMARYGPRIVPDPECCDSSVCLETLGSSACHPRSWRAMTCASPLSAAGGRTPLITHREKRYPSHCDETCIVRGCMVFLLDASWPNRLKWRPGRPTAKREWRHPAGEGSWIGPAVKRSRSNPQKRQLLPGQWYCRHQSALASNEWLCVN